MDKASQQKEKGREAGPLGRMGAWCRAAVEGAKGLAPGRASERLAAEADAQVVASQVMRAIDRGDSRVAGAMLQEAMDVYGKAAFERAMGKRCWSTVEGEHATPALVTPAEACAMLPNCAWAMALAEMVPAEHWADRTASGRAYAWKVSEEVSKRSISIASVGPLLRICANGMDNDQWLAVFEAVSGRLAPPGKAEALACKAVARSRSRADRVDLWMEKAALAAAAPDNGARTARRSAL